MGEPILALLAIGILVFVLVAVSARLGPQGTPLVALAGCLGVVFVLLLIVYTVPFLFSPYGYGAWKFLNRLPMPDVIRLRIAVPGSVQVDRVIIGRGSIVSGTFAIQAGRQLSEYREQFVPGPRDSLKIRANGRWFACPIPANGNVRPFRRDRYTLHVTFSSALAPGSSVPLGCFWARDRAQ